MLKKILAVIPIALALSGCATEFRGSAHVDRPYCENYCRQNNLEFSGMVALGEYSSGCICSKAKSDKQTQVSASSAAAAAAGVMMAMRTAQAISMAGASMAMQH